MPTLSTHRKVGLPKNRTQSHLEATQMKKLFLGRLHGRHDVVPSRFLWRRICLRNRPLSGHIAGTVTPTRPQRSLLPASNVVLKNAANGSTQNH